MQDLSAERYPTNPSCLFKQCKSYLLEMCSPIIYSKLYRTSLATQADYFNLIKILLWFKTTTQGYTYVTMFNRFQKLIWEERHKKIWGSLICENILTGLYNSQTKNMFCKAVWKSFLVDMLIWFGSGFASLQINTRLFCLRLWWWNVRCFYPDRCGFLQDNTHPPHGSMGGLMRTEISTSLWKRTQMGIWV